MAERNIMTKHERKYDLYRKQYCSRKLKDSENILEVEDLRVSFDTYAGEVKAVRGVTFHVKKSEILAIVGESGCGKTVTSQTLMKLNPMPPARIISGDIIIDGWDIVKMPEPAMQTIRGNLISMVFQDPMTYLNPTKTVGKQIGEALMVHGKATRKNVYEKVIDILNLVKMPEPERRYRQFPHEFSGGMRQRVIIAIALACSPKILIADEPTTALDVTIQAQILSLIKELREKTGTACILITHDLGVVANMADRVAVMYAGKIIETGTSDEIFYNPKHPYTWGLLESRPRPDHKKTERLMSIEGTPPDLFAPPQYCAFADRCEYAMKICREREPVNTALSPTHQCSCWLLHPDAPGVERRSGSSFALKTSDAGSVTKQASKPEASGTSQEERRGAGGVNSGKK